MYSLQRPMRKKDTTKLPKRQLKGTFRSSHQFFPFFRHVSLTAAFVYVLSRTTQNHSTLHRTKVQGHFRHIPFQIPKLPSFILVSVCVFGLFARYIPFLCSILFRNSSPLLCIFPLRFLLFLGISLCVFSVK